MLFRQTIIVYLMYIAVAARLVRACSAPAGACACARSASTRRPPTPSASRSTATRFWNVLLAGAIAGLGGAFFTLGTASPFNKEMTAGAGFIALAAVIFGRWDPIKATLAALLFGFASNLQNVLSVIGSPVPSEFMLMLPYVVTIFAVAGLRRAGRGRPAADGKPYIKA